MNVKLNRGISNYLVPLKFLSELDFDKLSILIIDVVLNKNLCNPSNEYKLRHFTFECQVISIECQAI